MVGDYRLKLAQSLYINSLWPNGSMKNHLNHFKFQEGLLFFLFFFLMEVRNATEAHIALMRGSPCVPRTLQMQLKRINICRVLRRWNQFIC